MSAWLVAMIAGGLTIGPMFQSLSGAGPLAGTEPQQAQDAIDAGADRGVQLIVLVEGFDARDAGLRSTVDRAVTDLRTITNIVEVRSPQAASDSCGVMISVTAAKVSREDTGAALRSTRQRADRLTQEVPGAEVRYGGGNLIGGDATEAVEQDINQAELISLPVTLIVLIFVFGGVAAAAYRCWVPWPRSPGVRSTARLSRVIDLD